MKIIKCAGLSSECGGNRGGNGGCGGMAAATAAAAAVAEPAELWQCVVLPAERAVLGAQMRLN